MYDYDGKSNRRLNDRFYRRLEEKYKYEGYTTNGMPYDSEIISENGCGIILFETAKFTNQQIKDAKNELRRQRDVVNFWQTYKTKSQFIGV